MASMNVLELNEQDFDTKISQSSMPVLVKFWAPWCGPCKMMVPVVDQLANDHNGKIGFYGVNIDNCQAVAMRYGVMSIPTIVIFKDGKLVEKFVGARTKSDLENILNRYL